MDMLPNHGSNQEVNGPGGLSRRGAALSRQGESSSTGSIQPASLYLQLTEPNLEACGREADKSSEKDTRGPDSNSNL